MKFLSFLRSSQNTIEFGAISGQDAGGYGFDSESKPAPDHSPSLSFDSMFNTTSKQYGFELHPPGQGDYELYKK